MNWLVILSATLVVCYGDMEIDTTTTLQLSEELISTPDESKGQSVPVTEEYKEDETTEIPNVTKSEIKIEEQSDIITTKDRHQETKFEETTVASLKESASSNPKSEIITTPKPLNILIKVSSENYNTSQNSQTGPVTEEYIEVASHQYIIQATEVSNVSKSENKAEEGSSVYTPETSYQGATIKDTTVASLKEDYESLLTDPNSDVITTSKPLDIMTKAESVNYDSSQNFQTVPVSEEYIEGETYESIIQITEIPNVSNSENKIEERSGTLSSSDTNYEIITTLKPLDNLVNVASESYYPLENSQTEPMTEEYKVVVIHENVIQTTEIPNVSKSENKAQEPSSESTSETSFPWATIRETTVSSLKEDYESSSLGPNNEIIRNPKLLDILTNVSSVNYNASHNSQTVPVTVEYKEVETNKIFIPTSKNPNILQSGTKMEERSGVTATEAAYEGTKIKETTLASFNKENESLPSNSNSEIITIINPLDNFGLISSKISDVTQSTQTEHVTEKYKEVETHENTIQSTKNPNVWKSEHKIEERTGVITTEASYESTKIKESTLEVETHKNTTEIPVSLISDNKQKDLPHELLKVIPELTKSEIITSESKSEIPRPIEITSTTSTLLEILETSKVSPSEEPAPSLHLMIPNLPNHVKLVNKVSSDEKDATVIHQGNKRHTNGSYKYGFDTSNGIMIHEVGIPRNYNKTNVETGKPARNIVVAGAFGWTAPDGQEIGIKYYADETGYHPEGKVLPTPPPTPPEILRALAWIRKVSIEKKEKELKLKNNR